MILIVFPTQWRGVVYASGGYPIMGATVNVRDRHTKQYLATAATDPNGRFDFGSYETLYAGGDYTLEVINGSEVVTIWGDTPFEVDVVTPEMARERRRREAEASEPAAKPWWRRLWGLP